MSLSNKPHTIQYSNGKQEVESEVKKERTTSESTLNSDQVPRSHKNLLSVSAPYIAEAALLLAHVGHYKTRKALKGAMLSLNLIEEGWLRGYTRILGTPYKKIAYDRYALSSDTERANTPLRLYCLLQALIDSDLTNSHVNQIAEEESNQLLAKVVELAGPLGPERGRAIFDEFARRNATGVTSKQTDDLQHKPAVATLGIYSRTDPVEAMRRHIERWCTHSIVSMSYVFAKDNFPSDIMNLIMSQLSFYERSSFSSRQMRIPYKEDLTRASHVIGCLALPVSLLNAPMMSAQGNRRQTGSEKVMLRTFVLYNHTPSSYLITMHLKHGATLLEHAVKKTQKRLAGEIAQQICSLGMPSGEKSEETANFILFAPRSHSADAQFACNAIWQAFGGHGQLMTLLCWSAQLHLYVSGIRMTPSGSQTIDRDNLLLAVANILARAMKKVFDITSQPLIFELLLEAMELKRRGVSVVETILPTLSKQEEEEIDAEEQKNASNVDQMVKRLVNAKAFRRSGEDDANTSGDSQPLEITNLRSLFTVLSTSLSTHHTIFFCDDSHRMQTRRSVKILLQALESDLLIYLFLNIFHNMFARHALLRHQHQQEEQMEREGWPDGVIDEQRTFWSTAPPLKQLSYEHLHGFQAQRMMAQLLNWPHQ